MARSTGTMKLSSNFEPRLGAPLDARIVVPTLADLTASGNFPYPYAGMVVAVQATSELYIYNGGTITSSDSWKKVGDSSLSGTVGSATKSVYLADGVITEVDYTLGTNVPSDAVFTDTDTKVTQSPTSTNANYEVLLSKSANNTEETNTVGKSDSLKFNPSTGNLQATQLNGVAIGNSPKFTDTTYESKSAASGGTDLSLVTTGEKATWNSKANGGHTHTASLATDSGTSTIDLAADTTYKLTAGGSSIIFKTPQDNNTTYESKSAASGGTDLSLVTTGEKYNWNSKTSLSLGTSHTTAAYGDHTHTATLATDSGTSTVDLAANTTYKLTAGGSSIVFKTPQDTNTTYSSKTAASGGTDVSLVTTGEKYTWGSKADGNHTHTTSLASDSGTAAVTLAANTTYKLTAGGTSVIFKTPQDTNTTYESKTAASGGTDLSLVTTGEKYTWNNKTSLALGTSHTTAAYGDHTHTASQVGAIASNLKGAVNGVAELDENGKVPSSQLPSYVDDVLEYASQASFPATGEAGKIYVDTSDNTTYRWSGTAYVAIGSSLALGETSSTAYRGDRGKTAYDHSQSTHARTDATAVTSSTTNGNIKINGTETTVYTHPSTTAASAAAVKVGKDSSGHVVIGDALTKSDVGLGNVGNFKAVSTVASQGLSSTEQSNARANIGAGTSSLALGTSSTTAAKGDHTHTTSLASDSGTATVSLSANTTYKLTAGGTSVIFKTPVDNNTTYSSKSAASGGTDLSLVTTGEKYTWNNKSNLAIGTTSSTAAAGNHTHTTTLATDSGTATVSLAANTTYKLTAGGNSVIFKTPVDNNTTYSSKSAASGGTDVSLVTTGEKYTWNNKTSLTIGTTSTTAAAGNHTHTASIAADSTSTVNITLAANTAYKLTAGGSSVVFKMPVDNNTTYSSKTAASGGTDVSLVTTGEKYTWNNKTSLTIGTTSTTAAAGNHTHTTSLATDSGTATVTMAANTTYKLTAGGTSVIFKTPPDNNTQAVSSVVGQTGAVTTAQVATALTNAGYKLTDNNTTYSGATQSSLGLIRIWASGDTLNISTAAS